MDDPVFKDAAFEADPRVSEFIGYYPYCPCQEGPATHERLKDVTRFARQCPRCGRIYIIGNPETADPSKE